MTLAALALWALGQSLFKETARLGVPTKIGRYISQGGRPQDWGNYTNITVNSARVALAYPSVKRVILTGPGQKLVVFNVTQTVTSTTSVVLGGDNMPNVVWWRTPAPVNAELVGYFDPKTKDIPRGVLKKGDKGTFDIVCVVPADYSDLRTGFYWKSPETVAWLDLSSKVAKSTSVFARGVGFVDRAEARTGTAFDLGPLELSVQGPVAEAGRAGDVASTRGTVLAATGKNTQAAPCRWGWQYVECRLILENGSKVGMYPSFYDAATGKPHIGDLPPGQSSTCHLSFSHDPTLKPVAVEMTWLDTKRTVRVSFGLHF